MEEIRKILQQSDNSLDSSDSSDSEVSFERFPLRLAEENLESAASTTSSTIHKRNGDLRRPTRRPDPTVYNRNALLARENRRKKKEKLEIMEKELDDAKSMNLALCKALKKQMKATRRLENEKMYFKSIVENRSEIQTLVTALNARLAESQLPKCNSVNGTCSHSSYGETSSRRSSSYDPANEPLSITFDNPDNGSVAATQGSVPTATIALSESNFFDNFLTDFEPTAELNNTWNHLLENDLMLTDGLAAETEGGEKNDINVAAAIANDDHCYGSFQRENTEDAGVCLHIARGRISLEFCPSCHWKASRTPPTQLLQDNGAV